MKRFVAVAALVAASFAAPVLPVQAAHHMMDEMADCHVLPMLKQECREMAHDWMVEHHAAKHAAVQDAWDDSGFNRPQHVIEWGNCARAPEGSGHLLDC